MAAPYHCSKSEFLNILKFSVTKVPMLEIRRSCRFQTQLVRLCSSLFSIYFSCRYRRRAAAERFLANFALPGRKGRCQSCAVVANQTLKQQNGQTERQKIRSFRPGNTLSSSSSPINYSSLHHHTSQACARLLMRPQTCLFFPFQIHPASTSAADHRTQASPSLYLCLFLPGS